MQLLSINFLCPCGVRPAFVSPLNDRPVVCSSPQQVAQFKALYDRYMANSRLDVPLLVPFLREVNELRTTFLDERKTDGKMVGLSLSILSCGVSGT